MTKSECNLALQNLMSDDILCFGLNDDELHSSLPNPSGDSDSMFPPAPGMDDNSMDLSLGVNTIASASAMDIATMDTDINHTAANEYVDVKLALSLYKVQQNIYLLPYFPC